MDTKAPDTPEETPVDELDNWRLLELATTTTGRAEKAWSVLYDRLHPQLLNFLQYRKGIPPQDAPDLAAQCLERLYLHGHKHDPDTAKVRTYAFHICGNLARNYYRNRSRDPTTTTADLEARMEGDRQFMAETAGTAEHGPDNRTRRPTLDPERELEVRELERALEDAMDSIGDRRRKALQLLFEGYSYVEIGDELGLVLGTVKSTCSRGRRDLREELERRGVDVSRILGNG